LIVPDENPGRRIFPLDKLLIGCIIKSKNGEGEKQADWGYLRIDSPTLFLAED